MKVLERTHGDYIANEPYYIFNFCLMAPEKQLDYFYVRELIPVEKKQSCCRSMLGLQLQLQDYQSCLSDVCEWVLSGFEVHALH